MSQLEFTAPTLTLVSYWKYKKQSDGKYKRVLWTQDEQVITFEVTGIPEGATVRRSTFTATLSKPPTGVSVATIDANSVANSVGGGISLRVQVRSNRTVNLSCVWKCSPTSGKDENTHSSRLIINNPKLIIVYDESGHIEPGEDTTEILVPKKTVKLFSPKTTDFTIGALCVLAPTSCIVSESAGGEYELTMEHPIDEYGKWSLLVEDYIIEAPIPPTYVPEVHMPPWSVWLTNKSTDLYTTLPYYTKAKNSGAGDAISNYKTWNSSTVYLAGEYVIYGNNLYYAAMRVPAGQNPTSSTAMWAWVAEISGSKTTDQSKAQYKPGVVGETLPAGELVYKIADYSATYMQVRSLRGVTGYVKIVDCDEQAQEHEEIEPPRILYTQLFRIYEVKGEDDEHSVTVSARHISYDLQKNILYDVQLEECPPATAIASIQGSMINDDETMMRWGDMQTARRRKIMTNMTEPQVTVNWSFQNPIQALLDPEQGLAGKLKAKVIRDNQDIFIIDNNSPRYGIKIAYGVNLRGVTWKRSIEDVITRIIPRAKDKNDKYFYLDDLYIDSEAINQYAVIATEVLDSEYKEGQKIKHLDGTTTTLSKSDVMSRMLAAAEDRFYVDNCDSVTVSLEVEFLLLGDTEEFKQYRNLQRLQIYDLVTVDTGLTNLRTRAQVSGYEWDCLRGRYNSISIGQVYSQSRKRIPGYRFADGAVTYSKLAPDLISYIKGSDE